MQLALDTPWVGGTIYANVIWPGMKWKYAAGQRLWPAPVKSVYVCSSPITNYNYMAYDVRHDVE